jgi:integrase
MGSIEYRPDRPKPYRARYWGLDGRQHRKSFARQPDAEKWLTVQEASKLDGSWADPNRGKIRFKDWADEWWATWRSDPRRSPNTLQAVENRLRRHVRPYFNPHRLNTITVQVVHRGQNELASKLGFESVMACRSLLYRILQAAEHDRLIPANPVRRVPAPPRPVDPETIFGRAVSRVYTPTEFSRFLAACPAFYRDHFIAQVGTGLRPGELLELHAHRVQLDLDPPCVEVVEVRYDAGKFGSGYKDRPKSAASIRLVPLAPLVAEAIRRRLLGCAPTGLVFAGPGGGNRVARGVRSKLSITRYRRVYKAVVEAAKLPQLALHGPHDLRHTFATWLEDGGIPARVIDELMGHTSRTQQADLHQQGSMIGRRYRHTTVAMQTRVVEVIQACLVEAVTSAEVANVRPG